MTTARQVISLLKSHVANDDAQFFAIAMQVAAEEARVGHNKVAVEIRNLIDASRARTHTAPTRPAGPVPLVQPKGEMAGVLSARYPDLRLPDMVLDADVQNSLERVLGEQRQTAKLAAHGLIPRRKLLLIGPPGAGKTMTANVLAGELRLPLFTVVLEGLISKFMGDTGAKLRLVFDAMRETRGVYFFDEFDAIGSKRADRQDVGEIRRVLNSFLQLLESDDSGGLVVCATNHAELLDTALFRRFDDVISYSLPSVKQVERLLKTRLASFKTSKFDWTKVAQAAVGLSHADITRAAEDSAKAAVLGGSGRVTAKILQTAIAERHRAHRS